MGYIRRKTTSQDGDLFTLGPKEFVVVTRVYDKRGLAELLWNGLTGLFPLSDIDLVKQNEEDRSVVIGGYADVVGQNMKNQDVYMGYNEKVNGSFSNMRSVEDSFAESQASIMSNGSMPSKMLQRQLKRLQNRNVLEQ